MRQPDLLYLGYSKAASTFLQGFFEHHPAIFCDRIAARHIHSPHLVEFSEAQKAEAEKAKIYVSMQERLCESVLFEQPEVWRATKWRTARWRDLPGVIDVDPEAVAKSWLARFADSRALIIIRDQADWLGSVYRYYVDNLDPGKRSFADFCATPKGMVLLRAGHYDLTIRAYLEHFGKGRLKVLRFERLARDRAGFLKELCDFLGIEPLPYKAPSANVGRSARAAAALHLLPVAGSLPAPLKKLATRALPWVPGLRKEALSARERRFIENVYAVSNLRTEKLLKSLEDRG
jgi:hypothetical protein